MLIVMPVIYGLYNTHGYICKKNNLFLILFWNSMCKVVCV